MDAIVLFICVLAILVNLTDNEQKSDNITKKEGWSNKTIQESEP
jgi:hypothetical protein